MQLSSGDRGQILDLSLHLLLYFMYASSNCSGKTEQMSRLVGALAARGCEKYPNLMYCLNCFFNELSKWLWCDLIWAMYQNYSEYRLFHFKIKGTYTCKVLK